MQDLITGLVISALLAACACLIAAIIIKDANRPKSG